MTKREQIIRNYIEGYNTYDVDRMVRDLADDVVFENIVNKETTMRMIGLRAFKMQAQQASEYFSSRRQTPTAFRHGVDETEVDIDYEAVVAVDMPGGPPVGTELRMQGRSVFTFEGDKIRQLTDIS